MRVGLRSITYTIGWHNLKNQEVHVRRGGTPHAIILITAGLYNFDQLKAILEVEGLILTVSRFNGFVTLVVPDGLEVMFGNELSALIGLDDGLHDHWLDSGQYHGDRPVSFAPIRALHIHLEQLDKHYNFADGRHSSLLAIVGLQQQHKFGDIITMWVEHPLMVPLIGGPISELKVEVRDDTGRILDNHNLPISVVLEISKD